MDKLITIPKITAIKVVKTKYGAIISPNFFKVSTLFALVIPKMIELTTKGITIIFIKAKKIFPIRAIQGAKEKANFSSTKAKADGDKSKPNKTPNIIPTKT